MLDGKKVIAVIPARGGSKRLPRKNILPLGGKPLIGWTIEAAQNSTYVDDIFNFDLFYCRDFGEPGFDDDLPLLKDPVIDANFGGVLQESIFIIEE